MGIGFYVSAAFIVMFIIIYYYVEKSRMKTINIALIACLGSFAAASRVIFGPLPNIKPATFLIALSGYVFGPINGFLIGSITAFVSNFFLGQGPWTPWQMAAWGIVGLISGVIYKFKNNLSSVAFSLICFFYGFLFDWIMNLWLVLYFVKPLTLKGVLIEYASGLTFDIIHAVSSFIFSMIFYKKFFKILLRFKKRIEYTKINVGGDNMNNLKKRKKVFISMFLVFFLLFNLTAGVMPAKAADFNAEVVIESYDKVLGSGTTQKSNAFEALKDVMSKNGITYNTDKEGSDYITSVIKDGNIISSAKFKGWDGWLYCVNSNGTYDSNTDSTSISKYTLKNGDKLIFYYGNFSTSVNNISFSTNEQNKPLTISLNNSSVDWSTGKTVLNKMVPSHALLDGKAVTVSENNIEVPSGLAYGVHNLTIDDFNSAHAPNVVADTIKFDFESTNQNNNPGNGSQDGSQGGASNNNTGNKYDYKSDAYKTAGNLKNLSDAFITLSFSKLGIKADNSFISKSYEDISKNGFKNYNSNAALEKLIIGLSAAGYNPYNFAGKNLVSELFNRNINDFYISEDAFALITYDYCNIKGNYAISRDVIINKILSQMTDSEYNGNHYYGWAYDGDSTANSINMVADITGMVLNALAPYKDSNADVKSAISKAVNSLSLLQDTDGDIKTKWGKSSESLSFTILGLTSAGENPEGSKFTKGDKNLVDAFYSYKDADGTFKHEKDGTADTYATEEALRALIALDGFSKNGSKYSLYSSNIDISKLPVYEYKNTSSTGNLNINSNAGSNLGTDNNSSVLNSGRLPQTGMFLDTKVLIIAGLILIICGAAICFYKRKKIK